MGIQQMKTEYRNAQDHLTGIVNELINETDPTKLLILNGQKWYYQGLIKGLEITAGYLWDVT